MKFFLNSHHNWVQLCTNIHWLNAISSRWSENFAARLRHAATAWWRRAKLPVSRPGYRSVWFFDITYTIDIHRTYCHSILQKNLWLIPYFMLLENAPLWPCVECIDKRPYIRIIHRTIMITINKITSETFSCYLTSLAMFACIPWLNTSINKLTTKCVKLKLTPLSFHTSYARYKWLLPNRLVYLSEECDNLHTCQHKFGFSDILVYLQQF